jgi:hypothetical protein
MSKLEKLASLYARHIRSPWPRTVAGAQRVVLVVYAMELERAFRARKGEFEQRTREAGHGWAEYDCTRRFAEWMAKDEYHGAYFEYPEGLAMKLASEFTGYVAGSLTQLLRSCDKNDVVALTGVSSLYGFMRISDLIRTVEPDIKGRLAVFFPGTKDGNNYRLLDARDGWNYLAYSITLDDAGGAL